MTRRIKTLFSHGIWIKNWKFKINEKPFNSKMTPTQISNTRHKIEKFAEKTLKSRQAWKNAGIKTFHHLIFIPSWIEKPKARPVNFYLTVKIIDQQEPPVDSVVAPPPPKQPSGL